MPTHSKEFDRYLEGTVAVDAPPKPIVVKGNFSYMDVLTGVANANQSLFPVPELSDLTIRNRQVAYISNRVTRVNVSLSTQLQSQITIEIEDPDFRLLGSGIFQGQPHVNYKGLRLELAGVATLNRGRGALTLKARSAKVQALKRRRGALTVVGDERSFIGYECQQVGLPFVTVPLTDTDSGPTFARRVSRDWQPYTQQSAITDADEIPSSWTTFKRLADQRGWLLFEANNVLYFAPASWLFTQSQMVRVRYAPTEEVFKEKWKPTESDQHARAVVVDPNSGQQMWRTLVATGDYDPGVVDVLEVPEFDHSSDRIETTVSFKVATKDVLHFLPGKVVDFHGVPYFDGLYLCMGVNYDLTSPDATITAQTPVDPQPQGSSTFGGFAGNASTSVTGVDLSGSGSDKLGLPACGITMKSFLKGLRTVESGSNYQSPPGSADGASGAYQYIGPTWRSYAGAAAAQRYPQAYLAPNDLQDQVAHQEVVDALRHYDDDWGKVAAHHIYPPTAGRPHLWKYRPFMEPGGSPPAGYDPLSNPRVIDYVRKVLKAAGGVSCQHFSETKVAYDFVAAALSQVGKPYEQTVAIDYEHTANPGVFDCSSLVQWAAAQVGVYVPRNSGDQWSFCESNAIDVASALKIRGALLWIDGGGRAGGEHVAISMGDGHRELAAHTSHAPLKQQINVRETTAGAWSRAALIPGMTYPAPKG